MLRIGDLLLAMFTMTRDASRAPARPLAA